MAHEREMGTTKFAEYVVGVDLALANTGWSIFCGGFPAISGTIVTSPKDPYFRRALRLKKGLDDILAVCENPKHAVFFCELSEWHQGLKNDNWKKSYAIEREVQFTQGIAHGIFYLWAGERGVTHYDLKVGEWHREFGSHDKAEIARLLSAQFPADFKFSERINRANRKVMALYNRDDVVMKDHESDAAGIAVVGMNRLRNGYYG